MQQNSLFFNLSTVISVPVSSTLNERPDSTLTEHTKAQADKKHPPKPPQHQGTPDRLRRAILGETPHHTPHRAAQPQEGPQPLPVGTNRQSLNPLFPPAAPLSTLPAGNQAAPQPPAAPRGGLAAGRAPTPRSSPVPPDPLWSPYRDQRAAAAVLLPARPLSVQPVGPAPVGAAPRGGRRRLRRRRRGGSGRRRGRGRLPVLAGPLGLGLQAALVQGEGLLALQLQALRGHGLVAGLAGAVVPPAELDAAPEPLHHRAVPRHHELRHGAGRQHHGPGGGGERPPLSGSSP